MVSCSSCVFGKVVGKGRFVRYGGVEVHRIAACERNSEFWFADVERGYCPYMSLEG